MIYVPLDTGIINYTIFSIFLVFSGSESVGLETIAERHPPHLVVMLFKALENYASYCEGMQSLVAHNAQTVLCFCDMVLIINCITVEEKDRL